jgi:hypothetical protein
MGKTVGYMLTWTTYGTWLQGEEKGFVKDGTVRGGNVALRMDCQEKLQRSAVALGGKEKGIVKEAILEAARRFKQNIPATAVCSNHVPVVCEYVEVPVGVVVGYYNNAGRKALEKSGYVGKVWTRGYDKRFCFDEQALKERIKYVEGHR